MRVSLRCLLFGHDDLVRRAAGRMFLECAECGRETRGWSVDVVTRPSFQSTRDVLERFAHQVVSV